MVDGVAALPSPGDTVAGKYRIERTIGEGGMSVVFGATHLVTGKRFAIKWLAPEEGQNMQESTQRFLREAQVAGRFSHPNVVEVYDVGPPEGAHYMVMEWLEGESLASKLEREGCLSFADMCEILIPCMHGIHDAHHVGIVHRDLKPANIFVCSATRHGPGRAKVLDFGVSKLMDTPRTEFNPFVTKVGTIIGTPYYVAPEQLRAQPVDRRADVYAFGVMMYELLSGMVPFPAQTFSELAMQIVGATPRPLRELVPNLPPYAEHVVAKAMARELPNRYQDVRALIEDLERVLAHEPPLHANVLVDMSAFSTSDTQPQPVWPPREQATQPRAVSSAFVMPKATTWLWIAGAAALVAFGVGMYEWLSQEVEAPQTVHQAASDRAPEAVVPVRPAVHVQAGPADRPPRAAPLAERPDRAPAAAQVLPDGAAPAAQAPPAAAVESATRLVDSERRPAPFVTTGAPNVSVLPAASTAAPRDVQVQPAAAVTSAANEPALAAPGLAAPSRKRALVRTESVAVGTDEREAREAEDVSVAPAEPANDHNPLHMQLK